MNFIQNQIDFLRQYGHSYLSGMIVTLELSFLGVILGFIIGLFICFLRFSKSKIVRNIGATYVEIIRGTPMMVQLLILFYGLLMYMRCRSGGCL